jgi:preprotein translocase subunit YajC
MEAILCSTFAAFLALAPTPTPPGTQPNPTGQMVQMLGTFALFAVLLYFLIIRPQRVRARQQDTLLKTLKRGDKVVTGSGIVGIVVSVQEKTVSIRSADTKLEILKSAVSEITERAGAEASS